VSLDFDGKTIYIGRHFAEMINVYVDFNEFYFNQESEAVLRV